MKKRKITNIAFLAIILVFMLTGLILTIAGSTEFLEYENRKANKMPSFSVQSYLDKSFQDGLEDALADQTLFAPQIREAYNNVLSGFIKSAVTTFTEKYETADTDDDNHEIYIADSDDIGGHTTDDLTSDGQGEQTEQNPVVDPEPIKDQEPTKESEPIKDPEPTPGGGTYYSVGGGMYIYKDYVVQGVASFKANKPRLDAFIESYNKAVGAHPEQNFYLYYIERDSDQNYATGYRSNIYDYIKESVNVPESNVSRQHITSFEEYTEFNIKSDHHWGYKGSYSGYKDILAMLKPAAHPLEPLGEYKLGYIKGSFTKTEKTANFKDDFYAYEFEFPAWEVLLNGKAAACYGNRQAYIDKAKNGNTSQAMSYGSFYGQDVGEIIIHNPTGDGSLLIFGNSYDNALIELLAAHYEYTYSIDLRYYKKQTGKSFGLSNYLENHGVDDILCVGNVNYYVQSPFKIPE